MERLPLTDGGGSGSDVIRFTSNGSDAEYGGNGNIFLELTIDGVDGNII